MSAAPAQQPRVSRGLLVTLGVVVGLAALAALWFFVASPLLTDDEPVVMPVADADGDDAAEEADEPDEADAAPPPETEEFYSARDPFQQLVQPAAAVAEGDGEAGDDDGGSGDDEPAPAVRVGETTVRLVDVTTGADGVTRVHVEVNGSTHEAAEDEQFAERFRVLDIAGECATFLFGDSRFTLCKGESISK